MNTIPFRGGAELGEGEVLNVSLGGESDASICVGSPDDIAGACMPLILAKAASGECGVHSPAPRTYAHPSTFTKCHHPPPPLSPLDTRVPDSVRVCVWGGALTHLRVPSSSAQRPFLCPANPTHHLSRYCFA